VLAIGNLQLKGLSNEAIYEMYLLLALWDKDLQSEIVVSSIACLLYAEPPPSVETVASS
jgi:hypothetical protein